MKGKQSVVLGHVHGLNIIGDDVMIQPLNEALSQAGLNIEQQLISQGIDMDIGLHPSLGRGKGGVAPLPRLERLDVIGHLTMQQAHPIGPKKTQATPETQISHTDRVLDRRVFGGDIAVVRHRFHGLEFGKNGILFGMKFPKCEHMIVRLKRTTGWMKER